MSTESIGHSGRKEQVLRILRDEGEKTVEELSEATGTSASNIRDVISRLKSDRAVESEGGEFVPGHGTFEKTWHIADRGERWLNYRESQRD